jgi:DMSO/TMAO reductase YedYZ molybdopterin-dependent catalytic subunit
LLFVLITFSCSGSDAKPHKAEADKDKANKGEPVDKLAEMNTPIFWAEGHPGALDRESWKISVTGACDTPKVFTWKELNELPQAEVDGRLTSVTRWSVGGRWKGIPLSELLKAVGMKPSCKYIRFWSVGEKYDTSIPLDIALKEKSLLAHSFDGEYLSEDYGGPIRAFIPYLWGYKSAKSVVKVELMEYYIPGFWEKRGYTDSAEIEAGKCRDINDGGKVKDIPDGEVTGFKQ